MWLPLLAISAAAVWYFVAVFVPHERSAAIEVWRGRLSAMADDRKAATTSWLSHRLGDAKVVAEYPTLLYLLSGQHTEPYLFPPEEGPRRHVQRLLDSMQGAHGYRAAYVLDAGGNVVVDGTGSPPLEPACRASVARLLSLGHPEVDLHAHADGLPMLAITAPVRVADRTVGAVLLSDDPARWLYPLLLSEPIPTRTGESLLAHQVGNQVEFLSPLRHRSAPPLSFRLPFALPLLAVAAIRGEEGFRSYFDYRGVRVLGVARRIPGTGWGLVVKVDEEEALSAFRRTVREVALAWLCVLLALAGLGFGAWRTQAASYRTHLGESEARFAILRDHANDAILFASRDGVILDVNRKAEESYVRRREELLGLPFDELRAPEERAALRDRVDALARDDELVFEAIHRRSDGTRFPVEVSIRVTEIRGQDVLVSIVRDMTERKRAEEALHESEERFRSLYENSTVGLYRTTPDGRILMANPTLVDMLGYASFDALASGNLKDDSFQPSYPRAQFLEDMERDGEVRGREAAWTRADGSAVFISESARAIRDSQGNTLYYDGSVENITERKRAEEEIRRLNAELEERVQQRTAQLEAANKELEAFSYSVSHDLRAPLRAIDGFSRIVLDDYGDRLDDEGKRQLDVIRANTQKMGRLIDDLLTFSRAGRAELHRTRITMSQLAHAAFSEAAPSPAERGRIDLSVGELPEAWADPALMRQVWVNLLSNAVKFSRPRERAVIHVTGALEDARVVYHVSDNGVGFDMRYVQKLFGVFQRLHTSREFEGTGVGLALVQRIVHRHGGVVWAEGAVDSGATFSFALPEEGSHE